MEVFSADEENKPLPGKLVFVKFFLAIVVQQSTPGLLATVYFFSMNISLKHKT